MAHEPLVSFFVPFNALLCSVGPVWHCDHLSGEEGTVCFLLVCKVCCPLQFVYSSSV